ncbi:hypothetical protein LJC20_00320 [Eubacteriales bacterium OttesenSCG-928-M02]|nr:hypothetical protein [Eubacteriales bacterium OttesenSCG-928-M02]
MKKRGIVSLIAAILGTAYAVYACVHFLGGMLAEDSMEAVGAGIATVIVMPHLICVIVAVLSNWIGYIVPTPWALLVAGIMYIVAAVVFPLYALFVVVQGILSFIGFASLRKKASEAARRLEYERSHRRRRPVREGDYYDERY